MPRVQQTTNLLQAWVPVVYKVFAIEVSELLTISLLSIIYVQFSFRRITILAIKIYRTHKTAYN